MPTFMLMSVRSGYSTWMKHGLDLYAAQYVIG